MKDFKIDLDKCIDVLGKGGLILYPTDTIWGVGCDATNAEAVERVYQLKKRPGEKAMIVLLADKKQIFQHVEKPDQRIFEYLEQSSKPTTVIYQNAKNFAENLIGNDGSIAIRICKDEFCKQLVEAFGKPIVSTSANISGSPSAQTFSHVNENIKKGVDYIVKYRQGERQPAQPSSIIKWENGKIVVIRP